MSNNLQKKISNTDSDDDYPVTPELKDFALKTGIKTGYELNIKEAEDLFYSLLSDNIIKSNPKVLIALGLNIAKDDKEKTNLILMHINNKCYNGVGTGYYKDEKIVLIKDIEKVKEILSEQTKKDKPSNLKMK